ncbi:alpha-actinin A, partial [Biomphalaria glabrata]
MGNKVDKMLSQLKEGVNSFVKEQLPVDSLVKKLRGQDCGCTNSGDGYAGDLSAVCVCVVGKSCGCDFQDEKRDGDCCDDLNGMYRVERKETNEADVPVVPVTSTLTEVCYVPEADVPVVPVTSTLTEVCYVPEADVPVVPVTSTLTEVCYVPEADVPVVPVTSTLTEVCYVPEADVPVVPVTSTLTEVCYVPEADVPVVPVTSTSMSLTEQDNVGSAFKPVAMDLKDLCLPVGAHEGNSKLGNCIQKFTMNCTCGASHIEFRCQENHQQSICTSTIIIGIGIDECQSDYSKSEPSRGRHVPLETEETCILDVKLLSEDDCGALDFVCNVAASEPAAPLRGVCREGLLRQRVRSTAVLKKTVLDPISLCGKRPHQDNFGSAFEPVAVDFKDLCLSAGAHEGNSKLDNSIQKFSMNCTCGASHIEFRCQENHQQRICTSTIIIDIGIDECQSNHSKSELSRERHFPLEPEETYLLDVRLLSEDDFGALDFACNVAASEPEAPLRGVCREGLLRQRVRSTAVLKKTVLHPISLCGKRPRHYRNNSL